MDDVLQQQAGELLHHASVVTRYENLLDQARGDHFNVFKVLRISRAETVTHSPMIGELLNPRGNHRKGGAFLKAFLEVVEIKNFEESDAIVNLEYHAGPKTEKSGGRLDILIHEAGSDRRIVIENKIDAGLQENQLERNADFGTGQDVLFLTLKGGFPEGFDPSPYMGLRDISYQFHIRGWLRRCRELAADSPQLRESIAQYLDLVDEISGNNPNHSMSNTLANKILDTRESYLAYVALKRSQNEVETNIFTHLETELKKMCTSIGLELRGNFQALGNTSGSFSFHNEALTNAGIGIGVEFAKSGYRDCDSGFFLLPQMTDPPITHALQESFRLEFGPPKSSSHWPAYRNWNEYRAWTEEVFSEIRFGNFASQVMKEVDRLLKVFQRALLPTSPPLP